MRDYLPLGETLLDTDTGILSFTSGEKSIFMPRLNLRREGENVAISAGFGPVEIAMRLRYAELARIISHLTPVDGLGAARQVGNGQVSIMLGLQTDGSMLVRPMLILDSSGHVVYNFQLTTASTTALRQWLGV